MHLERRPPGETDMLPASIASFSKAFEGRIAIRYDKFIQYSMRYSKTYIPLFFGGGEIEKGFAKKPP